ncbi:hypothetical protein UlMin_010003 [Ulmus minor]
MSSKECFDCVNSSSKAIREECSNQKEAILWGGSSTCLLRYSNRDFFGAMEVDPGFPVTNPNNISETELDRFNQTLFNLVGALAIRASSGSESKFATGFSNFTSSRNLYAMVQCTPDVRRNDCSVCLRGALDDVSKCCGGKEGGRFLRPSCFVWFELFQFYESSGSFDNNIPTPLTQPSPIPLTPPPSKDSENNSKKSPTSVGVTIIVPIVILATLLALGCVILWYRRSKQVVHDNEAMKSLESLKFDLSTIKAATDDFSDANKLGQGGFGVVYKGTLPNGQEIAVKRLSGYSAQGEEQFMNEILLVAKLQHRNLVSLLGFCTEASERLLIYEFVGNGSLDSFIFDPVKHTLLNWELRYKIICGIARGILYLHEDSRLRVIHRDLKASNVLLDEEMNPKISDFGLARLFAVDQSEANIARHMGTFFGVLVLEMVSGKKNSWFDTSEDVVHLLSYTWKNWTEVTASNMIDPTLDDEKNVESRPTMALVVQMLTTPSLTLSPPSRLAFFMYNSTVANMPLVESSSGESGTEQSTSKDKTAFVSLTT